MYVLIIDIIDTSLTICGVVHQQLPLAKGLRENLIPTTMYYMILVLVHQRATS